MARTAASSASAASTRTCAGPCRRYVLCVCGCLTQEQPNHLLTHPSLVCIHTTQSADRIIATPPGDTPPLMCADWLPGMLMLPLLNPNYISTLRFECFQCSRSTPRPTPDNFNIASKKNPAFLPFDTTNTYSFSYYSDNVSLNIWKGVNIPGLLLHLFFYVCAAILNVIFC